MDIPVSVELLRADAVTVACALLAYRMSFELLPVSAMDAALTSITASETVGAQAVALVVTVNVYGLVPINVVPLYV